MKLYEAGVAEYEVFGANMTVDAQVSAHSVGNVAVCQSCQCNCHLCRGGRAPEDETFDEVGIENALGKLLVA